VYSISEQDMLTLMGGWRGREYLNLPTLKLPDGARVERVCYSFECQCFDFMVTHISFEPVPAGMYPPREMGMCETVRILINETPTPTTEG
jgi:hypothetical protein